MNPSQENKQKRIGPRRFKLAGLFVLLTGLIAITGFTQDDLYFSIKKNLKIFGAVYEKLAVTYVDPVDPEKFLRGGMEAMLTDLDPYTTFYDEATHTDIEIAQQGQIAGIGLTMGLREGRLTILDLLPGFNGFTTGLRISDTITHIDGRATESLSPADAAVLLQGDSGTFVDLKIQRAGKAGPLDFKVERSRASSTSVSYAGLLPGEEDEKIVYVKLDRFAALSYKEVKAPIAKLIKEHDDLQGVVLDFRGNGGGLLSTAVDIISLFVPREEMVVSIKGRSPESEQDLRSRFNPVVEELPLAILMDSVSASASEVVAGAIQDLDRGVIIGETSFGKGLVQNRSRMPYNTSLNVTIAKYYSPSGRCIQAVTYGKDGARVNIPDSLRTEFRTRAGRIVRDGGGIEPDVVNERSALSDTEEILERRSSYSQFAAEFRSENEAIPEDFKVDDALFDKFSSWVKSQNYSQNSGVMTLAKQLENALQKKNYSESLKAYENLESSLNKDRADDLDRNANRVKRRIQESILAQYYPKERLVEHRLVGDREIASARDIILDTKRYKEILSVNE